MRWTRVDSRRLLRLLGVVLALHVVGWGVLGLFVVPHGYSVGQQVFGWGLGLTAYVFGVRHAFDADHIAVIDGTTRKLTGDGQRPLSVGFWFSLGHSTVVFAMAVVVATGARFASSLVTDGSGAHDALGVFGTSAAGVFLWVIGLVNLVSLAGILRTARRRRRGELDDAALQQRLALDGALARVLRRFTSKIRSPRQVYPAGLLMGLGSTRPPRSPSWSSRDRGCDPALVRGPRAARAVHRRHEPVRHPRRRLHEPRLRLGAGEPVAALGLQRCRDGVSVAVALGIGTVQLTSVLHEELGLGDAVTTWVSNLDTEYVGYAVAGLFLAVWIAALVWWRATNRSAGPRRASHEPV